MNTIREWDYFLESSVLLSARLPCCYPADASRIVAAECRNDGLQILYTVAALGIADALGQNGPQTSHQLAETLGIPLSRAKELH